MRNYFGYLSDDEPLRTAIVDALALSGTASALETLQVIEYRTAARIPELTAELNSGDARTQWSNQVRRGENLNARKSFLTKVRDAIQCVSTRPDPVSMSKEPALAGSSQKGRTISELLRLEENEELEFKAALRWDHVKKAVDPKLERRVLCSIAAFANRAGGTLLIGIDPQKHAVGIQNDCLSLKGDRDAFERHLRSLVAAGFGKVFSISGLEISFGPHEGVEICRVSVKRSATPVYLRQGSDEAFWVRNGNQNTLLKGKDVTDYVGEHFA